MSKTVSEILESGREYLAARRVESPESVMRILLGRILKCGPLEVTLRGGDLLDEKRLEAMRRGIRRVASGEPVQHVVGETDFMGHRIKADRRALVPRPETEILVETVLNDTNLWKGDQQALVDFGVGSGCISIAIASARPTARILAIDISDDALSLARENVSSAGLEDRIGLSNRDLSELVEPESIDAVIANPPYIPSDACEHLPANVRDHDPRLALDGGPSGTSVIEQVIETSTFILKSGGRLFMEIGADQAQTVSAIMEEAGFSEVKVTRDLAGRDRIVSGTLNI